MSSRYLIVGGGFVGAAIVCNLLAEAPAGSSITLVNGGGPLGRGMAYGTQSQLHLLNVPAARMSWTDDKPDDFVAWLSQHQEGTRDGSAFVARHLYGEYLGVRLREQVAKRADLQWHQLQDRVDALTPTASGQWTARLASGAMLEADSVFLALGNFTPACPHASLDALDADRYAADPWQADALKDLAADAPVALIGTGLTMLDQLLSLDAAGHQGPILALSRRGLLPLPHRSNELPPPSWLPSAQWPEATGPKPLLRLIRTAVRNASADGHDWRDVVVALRSRTPLLWQHFSQAQRAQFLRHLQPFWDVHRHRAAPAAMAVLKRAHEQGRLRVAAGRMLNARPTAAGVLLHWQPRQAVGPEMFEAARIFNCTGPSSRISDDRSILFATLQRANRLQPCPLGLGVQTDERCRLLDAQGQPQGGLYYVGPMLKSRLWEATAVPELRRYARLAVETALTAP